MHNAAIAALGLDWGYLAFDVDPKNLREAIQGAESMKFIGLNLTVPHKLLALDFVDELEESAKKWGAVNTILVEGRTDSDLWRPLRECNPEAVTGTRTRGFNTDADAISRAIEEDLLMELRGSSVLLLGAGGAGKTAALKLASCGVKELHLINRTREKAERISKQIAEQFPEVKVSLEYPKGKLDLALNATSLGLKENEALPFDTSAFKLKQAAAAYDMIYRPAKTRFLTEAERAGCKIANGLGMLLYQGAKALEIWSGQRAPVQVMRSALHRQVYGETA